MSRTRYPYDHVAWCYEAIASVGSLGAIPRLKASQVESFEPGQRVLYVGVGAGEDAVLAAQRGVALTGVDLSPAMLRRLARRLDEHALAAELVESDLLDYVPDRPFDVVVANFFLNVFDASTLDLLLARLAGWLEPDGRLLIADFRPPGSSRLRRLLYGAYYKPLNWAAWALGLCALHPIYDYLEGFERAGLRLLERTPMPLWPNGPQFYEGLVAGRRA